MERCVTKFSSDNLNSTVVTTEDQGDGGLKNPKGNLNSTVVTTEV